MKKWFHVDRGASGKQLVVKNNLKSMLSSIRDPTKSNETSLSIFAENGQNYDEKTRKNIVMALSAYADQLYTQIGIFFNKRYQVKSHSNNLFFVLFRCYEY